MIAALPAGKAVGLEKTFTEFLKKSGAKAKQWILMTNSERAKAFNLSKIFSVFKTIKEPKRVESYRQIYFCISFIAVGIANVFYFNIHSAQ